MKENLKSAFEKAYGSPAQVFAQAPGRIEFIGNHTDYNGGLVMGVAIDKVIMCAVAKRDDRKLCFTAAKTGEKVYVDIDSIAPQKRDHNWVNYPLGVFKFLIEAGLKADKGFNFIDMSSLPSGAGLSSSAAIEMSAALALSKLYGFDTDLKTLVRAGRKSENFFVGMPCGILDQGVSGFGKKDAIVYIDCLTEDFSNFPLPHGCKFWLFNSTKKHALVDGLYADRHRECMKAAEILSEGGEKRLLRSFGLADLEKAKGKMSEVVYKRARHIIEENGRVLKTKEALLKGDIATVGKLLSASHKSSRTLFENSCEELDFLVDTLAHFGHVYGARLSGGGFGGAVMALTDSEFSEADAKEVSKIYEKKFGSAPLVFTCTAGDGAKLC